MSTIPKLEQTSQEAIADKVHMNRLEINEQRSIKDEKSFAENKEWSTRLIFIGAVGMSALTLCGIKAVEYNQTHPVNPAVDNPALVQK